MQTVWNFRTAGQLTFGSGGVRQLGELALARSVGSVLIITDQTLSQAGVLDQTRQSLIDAGITVDVFDGGQAEPAIEVAELAIECARQCQPEAIVGLGGGSNMDVSKIAAVAYRHGGAPGDYFGFGKVPGPVSPLICVPTTAGTGSEVSHAAVLTDTKHAMKVSTLSQYIRPDLALVDPELTFSCPAEVTAGSGLDALTHAVEAYTATEFDRLDFPENEPAPYEGRYVLADMFAEKAIELIGLHLSDAVRDGANRKAREGMALAATLAGVAFSNAGVALVHALEYPLGGALHCSHGVGNGLLLPHVMRFNLPDRRATLARVAALLGEPVDGMSTEQAAEQAIVGVERLQMEAGIPRRIRDLGGTREQLPDFAEKSFAIKRLLSVNPRRASLQDLIEIFQAAY